MTNDIAQFEGLATDVDLRAQNRAVVADYMSRKGETRKSRYLLFTEDGSAGLYTSDTGVPDFYEGTAPIRLTVITHELVATGPAGGRFIKILSLGVWARWPGVPKI